MATSLLMEISQDEKERARYRSRRMAETDYYSNKHTLIDRERAWGEMNERKKIALDMRGGGVNMDIITRYTGFSIDEVLQLK